MTVFIVSFELGPDSEVFRNQEVIGGFVDCYVSAPDIRAAIDAAELCLEEDGYSIKVIERAQLFDADEWQHEPELIQACREVEASGSAEYGIFNLFENEYEH